MVKKWHQKHNIYRYRYLSNPYVTDHLVLNRDHRNLLSGKCTSNILDNLGIKKSYLVILHFD